MSLPQIVSREEWLEARTRLLAEEKALTRRRDALSAQRRELPMVEVTTGYRLTGPDGEVTLADIFEGRPQLIVQHFMFDPSWEDGCPSCTAGVDEVSRGLLDHLHIRDTTYALVSLAPIEKLQRYKARRGWADIPWYSSEGTTFNRDFAVTLDPDDPASTYNYRPLAGDWRGEAPGVSCFLRVDDRVFHTYSTFARGAEWTGGSYAWLDLTALGRQEEWEEPKGRSESVRTAVPDFAS